MVSIEKGLVNPGAGPKATSTRMPGQLKVTSENSDGVVLARRRRTDGVRHL